MDYYIYRKQDGKLVSFIERKNKSKKEYIALREKLRDNEEDFYFFTKGI